MLEQQRTGTGRTIKWKCGGSLQAETVFLLERVTRPGQAADRARTASAFGMVGPQRQIKMKRAVRRSILQHLQQPVPVSDIIAARDHLGQFLDRRNGMACAEAVDMRQHRSDALGPRGEFLPPE